MLVLYILAYGLLLVIQGYGLVRKGYWRDLVVASFLISLAFGVTITAVLGYDLPPFGTYITRFIEDLLAVIKR